MKNIIVILLLFLSFQCANAQNPQTFDCKLLQAVLKANVFPWQNHLYSIKDSITIVDTAYFFNDCQELFIRNQEIRISRIKPANISPSYTSGNRTAQGKIILTRILKTNKNLFKIYFYYPYTNETISLVLTQKKDLIEVKILSRGVF